MLDKFLKHIYTLYDVKSEVAIWKRLKRLKPHCIIKCFINWTLHNLSSQNGPLKLNKGSQNKEFPDDYKREVPVNQDNLYWLYRF